MAFPGIIELSMGGRGPKRGFVFDPHRLALPAWAEAGGGRPSVLVTLDRHFDTVPPVDPPAPGWTLESLDEHTRRRLDVRNYDHVLAAMEAGVVSHAIIVARARPVGAVDGATWTDSRGGVHQLVSAPTVDAFSNELGRASASEASRRAEALLRGADQVLLDVDLDCFTSPSDADPTTVLPWPVEVIRQHLLPPGSEAFWDLVLAKCVALTLAREPHHCGGLLASGRLLELACQVLFRELLDTDLP